MANIYHIELDWEKEKFDGNKICNFNEELHKALIELSKKFPDFSLKYSAENTKSETQIRDSRTYLHQKKKSENTAENLIQELKDEDEN